MPQKKAPVQPLTPENYIRLRVNKLPIYKCLINADWEVLGVANIAIARLHASGNITICFYYVDLYCLGIKDSFYRFNIQPQEYDKMIDKMTQMVDAMEIDYALAHNILYASSIYAEDLGFDPHPMFQSVTFYMLEEEQDDLDDIDNGIPYIDIECGLGGKPCYVQGAGDSDAMARQVIAKLTEKVGVGNFDFIASSYFD